MIRYQHLHGASEDNIFYTVARIVPLYSMFLLFDASKLYLQAFCTFYILTYFYIICIFLL